MGKEGREEEGKQGNMSAEILSTPPSSASGIGAWLSDLEGRLRYQPWWIYLTTLDRRLNSILDFVLSMMFHDRIPDMVGNFSYKSGF